MAKNKEYHFYNDSGFDEKIEALGFKRAVKSAQNKLDLKENKFISVEYINKKGKEINRSVKIPIGRSKKLGR